MLHYLFWIKLVSWMVYTSLADEIKFANRSDLAADQLYIDLLYHYQKIVRPVTNATEVLTVRFGSSLIRIIDVDEKNQVLTTNLWLHMQWRDHHLRWDPDKYGWLTKLHVPSDQIWNPDILLYNNAAGSPHVTITNYAMVFYDGTVVWKPPAIYKSLCEIDIEYFPYDVQKCKMKFGGWTHDGFYMDMQQIPVYEEDVIQHKVDGDGEDYQFLERGMDLSYYHSSAEWDLVSLTSERHSKLYPGCCGQVKYVDISFYLTLRRKALFYTVNLVVPCMLIAILTTMVFYLPSQSYSKISLSIAILVTLTVLFLVLIDLIPPTSLVIPLFGKYLLFTMMLVGFSIVTTVITLNLYNRNAATHSDMPMWLRWLFLEQLPKFIWLKPYEPPEDDDTSTISDSNISGMFARKPSMIMRTQSDRRPSPYFLNVSQFVPTHKRLSQLAEARGMDPDVIRRMIHNINFIADHFSSLEYDEEISQDWSYLAMVIDRLFLIIFTIVNIAGTVAIVLQAPTLYDNRPHVEIPYPTKPLGGDTLGSMYNGTF